MRGIIADVNIEGHVTRLFQVIRATDWGEFWDSLGLAVESFAGIGLDAATPDTEVWRTCQREQLVQLTANRNHDGPDSLEATILGESAPDTLPVLTVGDPELILRSSDYALKVAIRLLEVLDEMDLYRGTGRLYLP